jgi:hypothetical protein
MQTRARSNPRAAARRGGALGQANLGFSVFLELQRRGLLGRRNAEDNNA